MNCRILAAILLPILTACQTLPKDVHREVSTFFPDTSGTTLAQSLKPVLQRHPYESGFTPLSSGLEALAARLDGARAAQKSLDLQYYIWHNDLTGRLLFYTLLEAADRGVRVRLLLDDLRHQDFQPLLMTLARHPQIQVRIFNPFHNRSWIYWDFFTRFSEAQRRMHNKAMIIDNQLAIVGGRNIGDEYFQASQDLDFGDLDMLAVGPVVENVSQIFDEFWNSAFAYSISDTFSGNKSEVTSLQDLRDELIMHLSKVHVSPYADALKRTDLGGELRSGTLKTFWGPAVALSDSPNKVTDKDRTSPHLLIEKMKEWIFDVHSHMFLISAYFVPGDKGVEQIKASVDSGVKVRILTNSLASNDVSIVHPAYASYRKDLLKAGAEIYELSEEYKRPKKKSSGIGSNRAGLHGKAYFFDDDKVFVGSMNLDPRSEFLNTEMGFVVESRELSDIMRTGLESRLHSEAYHVTLNEKKDLQWMIERDDGSIAVFDKDPGTSWWKRNWTRFMSWFVPESLL